ncbi:MAG: amidohydrolase family protein, partial [Pirellulaceae bacterium]
MKYLLLVVTLLLGSTMSAEEPAYDLVIRNGRVIDGTGNPWFHADVAIKDGTIVALKRVLEESGRREIDAQGMVVAPGFIDMHSHSDYLLLEDGDALSKIHQGVTTEILGEGNSAGPNQGKRTARSATVNGKTVRWKTLGEYFQVLEKAGISTNVASYVGLNNAWEAAMGKSFNRPSEEQFLLMEQVVKEAMEDGALGLSCQVMMPPGSLATTDDVIRLAKIVKPFGGIFSTHIRNEGTGVFQSIEDAIRVAEEAGIPVDIIHLKIADEQYWGRMQEIVDLVEAARIRQV